MTVLEIIETIAKFLKVPSFRIQPETNLLTTFKMTQKDLEDLVYELDIVYGISIGSNYIKKIKTVNDILLYFETHKTNHLPK